MKKIESFTYLEHEPCSPLDFRDKIGLGIG